MTSYRPRRSPGRNLRLFIGEIEQDRAGLEHGYWFATPARLMIDDRGHAVVRGNREKFRPELFPDAYVHRDNAIFEPGLFEKDRNLVPVRRGPVVKVDHRRLFLR